MKLVEGDMLRPETLAVALDGVERVLDDLILRPADVGDSMHFHRRVQEGWRPPYRGALGC
jgi:hypothetical protein